MANFLDNLKASVPSQHIETLNGGAYISWVTALAMAQRPAQTVVMFNGKPALPMFGGVLVAVDMALPQGKVQRTWLPVLDNRNASIPAASVTAKDVANSAARCRAKAVAMVTGTALCLYANYVGDGPKFAQELGIAPNGEPAGVKPLFSDNQGLKYLDWATAVAAARITDPDFHWEVISHAVVDSDGVIAEKLALPFAKGWMVAVKTTWRGREHIELLPIMAQPRKGEKRAPNLVLENPTAADWNRAVMRCLAKSISVNTGYGLSLYAGEDLTGLAEAPSGSNEASANGAGNVVSINTPVSTSVVTNATSVSTPVASSTGMDNKVADLVIAITDNLRETRRDKAQLISWLGYPAGTTFESMPLAVLERAWKAIAPKQAKTA